MRLQVQMRVSRTAAGRLTADVTRAMELKILISSDVTREDDITIELQRAVLGLNSPSLLNRPYRLWT